MLVQREARGLPAGRWVSRTTRTASTTSSRSPTSRSRAAWLGRRGCGLLPIRGHSNVQGVGSVGVTPVLKQAFAERMHEALRHRARRPRRARTRTRSMAGGGRGSRPASRCSSAATSSRATPTARGRRALSRNVRPDHLRSPPSSTRATCTAADAPRSSLPVLARDEETQATTQESMFNFVRLSEGGAAGGGRDAIGGRHHRLARRAGAAAEPLRLGGDALAPAPARGDRPRRSRLRRDRRHRPDARASSRSAAAPSTSRASRPQTAGPAST